MLGKRANHQNLSHFARCVYGCAFSPLQFTLEKLRWKTQLYSSKATHQGLRQPALFKIIPKLYLSHPKPQTQMVSYWASADGGDGSSILTFLSVSWSYFLSQCVQNIQK